MAQERITWTSRIGFVLASAGAAVGLGAIWKFPYMAGTNGGSVFVLPFILLTFSLKSFSDVSAGAALSQPTGAWLDRLFCRQGIWAF